MPDLYPYQMTGRDFLTAHTRAYLADEMGLGKSGQALTAVPEGLVTIVAPAAVVPNWSAEWLKWNGADRLPPAIVSYDRALIHGVPKGDVLICDEAHYLKSPGAKRTRAVLKAARDFGKVMLLSGTPMPNHPGELWAPIKALWPHLLEPFGFKRHAEWLEHFCLLRPTPFGPKPYGVRNGKVLRMMLQTFMLRRKLAEVGLDLPPLRVTTQYLPVSAATGALLAQYVAYEHGAEEAYTSTLRRLLGAAKASPVARQIVEELTDGAYQAIVVMYHHRDVGDHLRAAFATANLPVAGYGGEADAATRAEQVRRFQAGEARVFLAQQTAAGVGINLTAATEIVLVEPAWSPDDNFQAIKRIHRIGQDQPCRARIFVLTGTLDEAIMGTIANKLTMQQEVFSDGEGFDTATGGHSGATE
jgi:SWI/SNF-related matrix-associated actin-dependent regulator 1 of chromatin subfamily A